MREMEEMVLQLNVWPMTCMRSKKVHIYTTTEDLLDFLP